MGSFGKKTRSPGYIPGEHWVLCDICNFAIRESQSLKTWNGLVVCPEDFEARHPQDLVRAIKDDTSPKGNIRSDENVSMSVACTTTAAVAGIAIAGCAITGLGLDYYVPPPAGA